MGVKIRMLVTALLWLCFPFLGSGNHNHINEDPVKMINIVYVNDRFAATEHLTGDFLPDRKQPSTRTPTDILNQLPEEWYILDPQDSVSFSLLVKPGERMLTVFTRKEGSADSSKILVKLSSGAQVECQVSSHSVTNCSLDVAEDVEQALIANGMLEVQISVLPDSLGSTSIWEIDLNNGTDDVNIRGFFGNDAREVLQSTEEHYGDEAPLTMVSFVGSKQVGKSTIASLLSGNERMFENSTTGADISHFVEQEVLEVRVQLESLGFNKPRHGLQTGSTLIILFVMGVRTRWRKTI